MQLSSERQGSTAREVDYSDTADMFDDFRDAHSRQDYDRSRNTGTGFSFQDIYSSSQLKECLPGFCCIHNNGYEIRPMKHFFIPSKLVKPYHSYDSNRVAELHPALAEAANHIAAVVHEEATTGSSSTQGQSSGYSYSLDALSDEEDMDSSQSSDSQPQGSGLFPSSPGASNPGPSNSLITSEMFSHAMERAIANVSTSSGDTPLTADSDTPFSTFSSEMETNQDSALGGDWQTQLQQMRELGLTDDAVNTQALRATAGDVQSAIELVFSGAITPDSH
uniref:UBA domain-containing protein n=1 Tax=Timema monikensis TaxID=170555 RepID=A0A7R9EGB5_9NEOP|nr:unnamed protein product [Timema monikensis]